MFEMQLKTYIIYLLIFLTIPAYGTGKVDSLLSIYKTAPTDQEKYEALSAVVAELENTDRTKVTRYALELIALSQSMKDQEKEGEIARIIGRNYLFLSKNDSSKLYLQKSYDIFESLGDTAMMFKNLGNLALISQRENDYEKATEQYIRVIDYSKSNNKYYSASSQLINLASIYIDQEKYDIAVECLEEIEKIYKLIPEDHEDKDKVKKLFPVANINLGICYTESSKLKDYQKALDCYDKVLESTKTLGSPYNETYYNSYAYKNKGDIYVKQAEDEDRNGGATTTSESDYRAYWVNARTNYELALDGFKEIENPRGIIFSKNSLANALAHLDRNIQAQELLNEALTEAKADNFKEEIRDAFENMAYNEERMGNSNLALEYYRNYVSYKDSIRNEERDRDLSEFQTKYKTLEKDKEIAQLAVDNEIQARKQAIFNAIFISAILGILILGYLWYTRYKYKQQIKRTEFEQNLNQAMAKFVPMKFINALGKDKITDVNLGDQIEKEVSVVFTDIRGFTSISEKITPKENFKLVKDYSEVMGPIILKNNGFINQYMGDGIMAIFDGNPEDALKACIEMQDAAEKFSKEQTITESEIRVGMGMHTGNLVLGIIGDENRRDAALISDTVNSAARMESSTKTYGARIILSEKSVRKLINPDQFNLRFIGEFQAKGKEEAIKLYECYNADTSELKAKKARTQPIFDQALKHFIEGSYDKSIVEYQKVIEMNPADTTAIMYLAMARKQQLEIIEK
jgi:class 3 adenylate cyclase